MLILAAILLTLLTPLISFGLSFVQLRRGYLWFINMISTLIALVLVLVSRKQIPISIPYPDLSPNIIFFETPMLSVDNISWPFAIAILTLVIAVLLIDIVQGDRMTPQIWAVFQAFGGLGLIAIFAGNPLAMLIIWSVIDVTEFVVLLFLISSSRERERLVVSLSVRIAGSILLISAIIIGQGSGTPLSFETIPKQVGGLLMLAAILRLGVLPPNQPSIREPLMRRNMGTMIRFIPSIAGIMLLVRAADVELTGEWFLVILALATIVAILSAIFWLQAANELQGRSFWILGFSAYALAAAVQGQQHASVVWGIALLFSGALLFWISKSHRWIMILIAIGVVGFSGLPLTPTWDGSVRLFELPWLFRIGIIISQSLMIVGYVRFSLQPKSSGKGFESWMWLVYSIGLIILPITHFGLFYTMWISGFHDISFQSPGWWSGLISVGVAAIILFKYRQESILLNTFVSRFANILNWIFRFIWWGYRAFGRSLYVVNRILEGEGSVLWAILILIMLTVTISLWGSGENFGL